LGSDNKATGTRMLEPASKVLAKKATQSPFRKITIESGSSLLSDLGISFDITDLSAHKALEAEFNAVGKELCKSRAQLETITSLKTKCENGKANAETAADGIRQATTKLSLSKESQAAKLPQLYKYEKNLTYLESVINHLDGFIKGYDWVLMHVNRSKTAHEQKLSNLRNRLKEALE